MNTNSISDVQAAVDWVTLTGDSWTAWERVQSMAVSLLEESVQNGSNTYYQSRHGFRLKCASGIQYGRGAGNWIVVLSGGFAAKYWMAFAPYAKTITRLDLQVTLWYTEDCVGLIEGIHSRSLDISTPKERQRLTIILNGSKGDTLYVGSRASAQFGRLYDKQRQSSTDPFYVNAIRYEVEYKKPLSGEVMRWLLDEDPPAEAIASRVLGWFSERKIEVPIAPTNRMSAIGFPRKEVDVQKKLEWLRKTVRPVYNQLKLIGWQTEADAVIGVSEDITTINDRKEN